MIAVIETGGKQYRVGPGDVLRVEKLPAAAGETVALDKVLLVTDDTGTQVGNPYINGATVQAAVLSHGRGDKLRIFKLRRRKNSRTQAGHRQAYTELEIKTIQGSK